MVTGLEKFPVCSAAEHASGIGYIGCYGVANILTNLSRTTYDPSLTLVPALGQRPCITCQCFPYLRNVFRWGQGHMSTGLAEELANPMVLVRGRD